nr:formin-like protein 5 [Lolium perenne]
MTRPKKLRSGPRSADRARSNHQLPCRHHREASQPDPNAGADDRRTRALRPGKASSAPPPPRLGLAPPTPGSPAAPRRNRRGAPLLDPSHRNGGRCARALRPATHPPASPSPGWDLAAPPPGRSAASSSLSPCRLPGRGPPLVRGLPPCVGDDLRTRAADLPPPPPRSPYGVSLRAGEPAGRADPARRL